MVNNSDADALSRSPLPLQVALIQQIVDSDNVDSDSVQAYHTIEKLLRQDSKLLPLLWYLQDGELPEHKKHTKHLVQHAPEFFPLDVVLYFIDDR